MIKLPYAQMAHCNTQKGATPYKKGASTRLCIGYGTSNIAGADESGDAFDRIIEKMARTKPNGDEVAN
jgi:hypothetical protein